MTVYRGEIVSFDNATWTATIRLWTSLTLTLDSVPVSHTIPEEQLTANSQIVIEMFDDTNPKDAVVIAVYDGTPADETEVSSALHDALTLDTNTASALSLTGQALSLLDKFVQLAGDSMSGDLAVAAHAAFGAWGALNASKIIHVNESFTNTSGDQMAMQFVVTSNAAAARTGRLFGVIGQAVLGGSSGGDFNSGQALVGGSFEVYNNAARTITAVNCIATFASVVNASGVITTVYHIKIGNTNATGTITNLYGLYIPQMTQGSSVNYAVYTVGTTPSYFGGILETGDRLRLPVLTSAPSSPQNGDIVYADGTSWNPGSGAGIYAYEAGAWAKL